jgi:hypothetical protein
MICEKKACINGCMVKSNLVISLVPYEFLAMLESKIGKGPFFKGSI